MIFEGFDLGIVAGRVGGGLGELALETVGQPWGARACTGSNRAPYLPRRYCAMASGDCLDATIHPVFLAGQLPKRIPRGHVAGETLLDDLANVHQGSIRIRCFAAEQAMPEHVGILVDSMDKHGSVVVQPLYPEPSLVIVDVAVTH